MVDLPDEVVNQSEAPKRCPRCGSQDPLIVGEACGYHPIHTPHRWHIEAPRVRAFSRSLPESVCPECDGTGRCD